MTGMNKLARRALLLLGMGMVLVSLGTWVGPVQAAEPTARPVSIAPGVQLDVARGVLSAAGSCAADLYAVSAEVARYKAERLARIRAEARLKRALTLLGRDAHLRGKLTPELLAQLDPAQAKVATIEYAATGSVSLRLELALTAKPPGAAPAKPDAGLPDDGGASPSEGEKGP